MNQDIRGYLPGQNAATFLRWIEKGRDRESATECLRRELHEEMQEIGHPELSQIPREIEFCHVRTVTEKPQWNRGNNTWQVRHFEVYELLTSSPHAIELRDTLISLSKDPREKHVLRATSQEIIKGRTNEHLLGPQSAFLIGKTRYREDIPPREK